MSTSIETDLIKDMKAKGLDDDQEFRLSRLQALLSSHYKNYRWFEDRLNRKKTKKNPKQVLKLEKRQKELGEKIDEYEDAINELRGKK